MFRVGIVSLKGKIEHKDFKTRDEVDNYILEIDEKEGIKNFRIEDNGKLIETEKGVR